MQLNFPVTIIAGDGGDFDIFHTGSATTIDNATGHLTIQNSADDKDIIFKSDDGTGSLATYFRLDGGLGGGDGAGTVFTIFPDNARLGIGSNADLRMFHDGADSRIQNILGDLYIQNSADDKDIIFRSDDGSGSLTTCIQMVVLLKLDFQKLQDIVIVLQQSLETVMI